MSTVKQKVIWRIGAFQPRFFDIIERPTVLYLFGDVNVLLIGPGSHFLPQICQFRERV